MVLSITLWALICLCAGENENMDQKDEVQLKGQVWSGSRDAPWGLPAIMTGDNVQKHGQAEWQFSTIKVKDIR